MQFRRKGQEYVSEVEALEFAEFFSWRFFQEKITFIIVQKEVRKLKIYIYIDTKENLKCSAFDFP